jgi:glycosyltransferase involved in cell wall biosynthesis
VRVVDHICTLSYVDEILIGINPMPGDDDTVLSLIKSDSRIKVFIHSEDLGLYGNFRFLLKQAQTKYFVWHCTDDQISRVAFFSMLDSQYYDENLVIPFWKWAEYHPDSLSYDLESASVGTVPNLQSSRELVRSILFAEPS